MYRLVLILSFVLFVAGGEPSRVQAQNQSGPPPTYGPFTAPELQSPDFRLFHLFALSPTLRVPLTELQQLLNRIQPGGFTAISASDILPGGQSTEGLIFADVIYERILEVLTGTLAGTITGPFSELAFSTVVVNNVTSQFELAVVAVYETGFDQDALFADIFFGGPVSREAAFKWEIKQEAGRNWFKVGVKGVDGFSFGVEATVFDTLGKRERFDPFVSPDLPVPLRLLSDGPSGAHRSQFIGIERDVVEVPVSNFKVSPSDFLYFPNGKLRILGIAQRFVYRSVEQNNKIIQ